MKVKKSHSKLMCSIRVILLRDWDPVGIKDLPEAADEYDMYIPYICKMIMENRSAEEFFRYLCWVEIDRMGLELSGSTTIRAAKKLASLSK